MRKLKTVPDILDALREENGWPSDYRIGKELSVPQQTVSSWRTGSKAPSETHAIAIGNALKISPVLVLAIAAAARTDDTKMRKAWSTVVDQFERLGLPLLAPFVVGSATYVADVGTKCILSQIDGAPIPSDSGV